MLSSAVVVFREVFEIVLILGIVLAATRGMPRRVYAIGTGLAAGIGGAGLIAVFIDNISAFAEGLGQEIFNAAILFSAAAFIGWTLVWMKKHAREMKAHFEEIGHAVTSGKLPLMSLSMVIALAILREGSEIVLFTYGMLASGQSAQMIMLGSAVGLFGGAIVGVLLYMGLVRISMKHFFRVTGTLLMLLVAGMMSQGIGFLTAAGMFESLSAPVWDSSWLLSEHGVIGETLKALIGYTAQPSIMQIIVYLLTLGGLTMIIRLSNPIIPTAAPRKAVTASIVLLFVLSLFLA
jgi:high-affinity iron transporter